MAIGALGVVYGDIGTSPLYAIRECFLPSPHGVAPTPGNILGILSLFFWSLTLVISVKYLTFVMRADNHGEGGIMALLALVAPKEEQNAALSQRRMLVIFLGLFGTALLSAEGVITPAISVLSAVEGLKVATDDLEKYVVPITVLILLALFLAQKYGTGGIASVFGPVMLVWFVSLALLGIPWIIREPRVWNSLNPYYALAFFLNNGLHGFRVLGAVVLCITGAEALYADMGHFGRRPIKLAWFSVAFPGLLLNYFGQGAIILNQGAVAAEHPFFALAGRTLLYPMVGLATIAAVIASQALISGAYSLAQQAIQLGYCPRLTIVHTSSATRGQIYMPELNKLLMVGCIAIVIGFRGSSNLAAAYGMAVVGTMTITTLLLFVVAYRRWGWSLWKAGLMAGVFLVVDLTYLGANLGKLPHGGWLPLLMGIAGFSIMTTWKRGRGTIAKAILSNQLPITTFLNSLEEATCPRVKGTAVFMNSNPQGTPVVLLHHFKHNKVLHERVIILCVQTEETPEVPAHRRVTIREMGKGFYQVVARYGYMQIPNVPDIFRCCDEEGLTVSLMQTSFYLGRETLVITRRKGLAPWRKSLFAFLSRNALSATAYFGIPPNRVVELGAQVEL